MNIDTIRLAGFMSHADSLVRLPRTGVVLVTGDNGAGKSSIIEAVSVAGWGTTLRGADPWRADNAKGLAALTTVEGLSASRARTKTTKKLTWSAAGDTHLKTYETTGKAQDALEEVIGSWDVWRRTCVFSSSDAAHFSLATDGERKRLLEQVLGLDRFDTASERCRADLRAAESAVARAKSARDAAIAKRDAEHVRMRDNAELLAAEPPVPDVAVQAAEAARLEGLCRTTDAEIRALEIEVRKADAAGGEEASVARQIRATLARLQAATCPTCAQPITVDLRLTLTRDADASQATAKHAHDAAIAGAADASAALDELRAERAVLAKKAVEARAVVAQVEQATRRAALLARLEREATAAHAEATVQAEEASAALEVSTREAALVGACDVVLALRGVRATVLGDALSGIEAVANDWLARLAEGDLRLKLDPYATRKSGATSEVIAMDVIGAGGGYGYRASSGGERRRIDIAIMLALAEISAAAYGVTGGTLFFDEVLDALDVDGVTRAADALEELGRTRCVVVITHAPALQSAVRSASVIRVTSGVVR